MSQSSTSTLGSGTISLSLLRHQNQWCWLDQVLSLCATVSSVIGWLLHWLRDTSWHAEIRRGAIFFLNDPFVYWPIYPFQGHMEGAGVCPSWIWVKEGHSSAGTASWSQGPGWAFGGSVPCSTVPQQNNFLGSVGGLCSSFCGSGPGGQSSSFQCPWLLAGPQLLSWSQIQTVRLISILIFSLNLMLFLFYCIDQNGPRQLSKVHRVFECCLFRYLLLAFGPLWHLAHLCVCPCPNFAI